MTMNVKIAEPVEAAVLDAAHIGHIRGAFGTILHGDVAPRNSWKRRLTTLLAVLGPGLIVMVGDNDAGAFATYGRPARTMARPCCGPGAAGPGALCQSGDGAAPRRGDRRRARPADLRAFRRFWGAFSVIDLFLLNALTIVTEFIGISLALDYLGLNKVAGVVVAAGLIIAAAGTGDFRRFERFAMLLVFGSLLLLPIYFFVHPPLAQVARDFFVPQLPASGKMSDMMLLVIGHRRHNGRALAALLPAELRDRQAHHAALHPLRAAGPLARHRARRRRRDGDDRRDRDGFRRNSGVRQFHRRGRHRHRPRKICRARGRRRCSPSPLSMLR